MEISNCHCILLSKGELVMWRLWQILILVIPLSQSDLVYLCGDFMTNIGSKCVLNLK
jgi:hypothetical protein